MKKTTKRKLIVAAVGLAVAVVVAALVWAFLGKKDSYCSVIPNDAVALARIDARQFFNEHDIDFNDQKYLPVALVKQMIDKCGVDFSKPIYAFACSERKLGAVIPLKDVELFREFLKTNGLMSFSLSQAKGYDWAMSGQYIAVFDSEKCLMMTGAGMNVRKELVKLMEQDADDSVLDEDIYENISRCKKPLAAIISVEELYKQNISTLTQQMGVDDDAFDMDILFSFDAKKEKATLALDILPNSSEARSFLKDKLQFDDNLKGKFVNAIDSDPLLWFSFSGMQHISKNIDKLPQLDELKSMGIDVKALAGSFVGDATIIVPKNSVSDAILLAEVKDNNVMDIFKQVEALSQGAVRSMRISDNQYILSANGQTIFAGVQDKTFYLTNSQSLVAKVTQNINSNVSQFDDEITSAASYMTVSAEQAILAASKLQPSMRSIIMLLSGRLSKLDRLYFSAKDSHFELVLKAKDGNDIIESMIK